MIKFLIFFLLLSTPSWATITTWYVRDDGAAYGTDSTHCNGQTDAAYVTNSGPNCAVASLYDIMSWSSGNGTMRIGAGDTVIIGDPTTTPGSYMIGLNRSAVLSGCNTSFPYACTLDPIPTGTSLNYTKLYGRHYKDGCAQKTQIWGSQGATKNLDLSNHQYIDIECLELTDHSSCGFREGGNQCSEAYPADVGNYSRTGLNQQGAQNIILKNIDIHGMAYEGIHGSVINLTLDHVNLDGNHEAGFDYDDTSSGGTGELSGVVNVSYTKTRFSGCTEAYPRSASFNTADYNDCVDQNSSGGYGDGWGGSAIAAGSVWTIKNSEWSHNVQDGLDNLHSVTNYTMNIDKSLFEGNDGNQLKFSFSGPITITNTIFVANCTYFSATSKTFAPGSFVDCRANGTPISGVPGAGASLKIVNSTFYTANGVSGSAAIELNNGSGNGTETYTFSNNINRSNDAGWTLYYNGLTGGPAQTALNNAANDHVEIYNFQSNPCPSGTGNLCASNPQFVGAMSATADSNVPNLYLTSSSPGKGAATSGNSYWNNSKDWNTFPLNSPADMGALQYTSSLQCSVGGFSCVNNSDCCSNVCNNFVCYGGGAGGGANRSVSGTSKLSGSITF